MDNVENVLDVAGCSEVNPNLGTPTVGNGEVNQVNQAPPILEDLVENPIVPEVPEPEIKSENPENQDSQLVDNAETEVKAPETNTGVDGQSKDGELNEAPTSNLGTTEDDLHVPEERGFLVNIEHAFQFLGRQVRFGKETVTIHSVNKDGFVEAPQGYFRKPGELEII